MPIQNKEEKRQDAFVVAPSSSNIFHPLGLKGTYQCTCSGDEGSVGRKTSHASIQGA